MRILILGGTAWLGREIAGQAVARGHAVSCLARGASGAVAEGAELVAADRALPDAYGAVASQPWDAVVELSWQPGFVRSALAALGGQAAHWSLISTTSVYAAADQPGADESAELLAPLRGDRAERSDYGSAKAAAERDSRAARGDSLFVVRPGVIGGPGDESGRSGAWVARAARAPDSPMLVAADSSLPTQVVDVRDLASFVLDAAERGTVGTVNAVGPVVPLGEWVELSRRLGGHAARTVPASSAWLLARGVEQFMGEESLALWLPGSEHAGFSARSGQAAVSAGLRHRPRSELLADVLRWEREQGLGRPGRAGLSAERETELLRLLAAER